MSLSMVKQQRSHTSTIPEHFAIKLAPTAFRSQRM